jgi:thiamine biosynthesis lipoprotein
VGTALPRFVPLGALVGASVLGLAGAAGCEHAELRDPPPAARAAALPYEVGDGRYLMGTILDITLLGDDPAALRTDLEWAFDRVAEIEAVASRHRRDSELSRFNAAAGGPPRLGYSPHLRTLLVRAVQAGRVTGGAFDVTVGPLVSLWWDAAEHGVWPSDAALREARDHVGFEHIVVTDAGGIGLSRPGFAVDFGGIGKGYALDVVRAGLVERGVARGLLDFGGSSVWAMGRASNGGPWRLEVDVRVEERAPRVLALVDRALSVSSSLGKSSMIGERRVGHVIDPRTGRTVDAPRTAVSVSRSATEAEVWSTALLVLETDEGIERSTRAPGIEAWVRSETGEVASTPGFAAYWAREDVTGAAAGAATTKRRHAP